MGIIFRVWNITPQYEQDGSKDEHPHKHEKEEDLDVSEALFNKEDEETKVLYKS